MADGFEIATVPDDAPPSRYDACLRLVFFLHSLVIEKNYDLERGIDLFCRHTVPEFLAMDDKGASLGEGGRSIVSMLKAAGVEKGRGLPLDPSEMRAWCDLPWGTVVEKHLDLAPDRMALLTRCSIANVLHNISCVIRKPFMKVARWMVDVELPRRACMAAEGPSQNFAQAFAMAGYERMAMRNITVRTLREWNNEANVPRADTIKPRDGYMTVDEYVSLARAGHLPGAPLTKKGMGDYIHRLYQSASSAPPPRRTTT